VTPLTYLFVPGNRPERFAKAMASAADRVILDLEDAVAPADKASARSAIGAWLAPAEVAVLERVLVRINDALSPWNTEDMAWLQTQQLGEVMLSKCESPEQVAAVLRHLPPNARVLPLMETVSGVHGAAAVAAAPGVSRLAFGSIDYQLDLDVPSGSPALEQAAVVLVVASRLANLPAPIAGVTPELDNASVAAEAQRAHSLGFGAKLCIHPQQLSPARQAFLPSPEAQAWARRVVDAWEHSAHTGAVQVDARMVDKPVYLRAQRILAQSLFST
jgi:citrate lyase subunit beta / citryl-CoA lyase